MRPGLRARLAFHMWSTRWPCAVGILLALGASACDGERHRSAAPQTVAPAVPPRERDAAPAADAAPPSADTMATRMRALFAATQAPDTAAAIAKLEAQRASLPEPER